MGTGRGTDAAGRGVEAWKVRANMVAEQRAIGGWLIIRDGRLSFLPGAVDRSLGATEWSRGLDEITSISVAERNLKEIFAGGLRGRLCVEARGVPTFFVVNNVERTAAEIRELVQRR